MGIFFFIFAVMVVGGLEVYRCCKNSKHLDNWEQKIAVASPAQLVEFREEARKELKKMQKNRQYSEEDYWKDVLLKVDEKIIDNMKV